MCDNWYGCRGNGPSYHNFGVQDTDFSFYIIVYNIHSKVLSEA